MQKSFSCKYARVEVYAEIDTFQYVAPGIISPTPIQECFLAFIDEVLPRWPILSTDQVLEAYTSHRNSQSPGINGITPGYRLFCFILAIGNLVGHLRNPYKQDIEEVHHAHWPVFDVHTRCPQDPLVQVQLRALDFLHARYVGLNSRSEFINVAKNMQL